MHQYGDDPSAAMFSPRDRSLRSSAYSRFVSLMKLLLPVTAFGLIVLVVSWPYIAVENLGFRLGLSALVSADGGDPSMLNPRYFGADDTNQAFSISADLARNLSGADISVELEMPKADITMDDGTWLVLTATTGVYTRDKQTLGLRGNVNLFHDGGYEFQTETANVSLNDGIADGDSPVIGQGSFGTIEAQGFIVHSKGKTIYFKGRSKLLIYPGSEKK